MQSVTSADDPGSAAAHYGDRPISRLPRAEVMLEQLELDRTIALIEDAMAELDDLLNKTPAWRLNRHRAVIGVDNLHAVLERGALSRAKYLALLDEKRAL